MKDSQDDAPSIDVFESGFGSAVQLNSLRLPYRLAAEEKFPAAQTFGFQRQHGEILLVSASGPHL